MDPVPLVRGTRSVAGLAVRNLEAGRARTSRQHHAERLLAGRFDEVHRAAHSLWGRSGMEQRPDIPCTSRYASGNWWTPDAPVRLQFGWTPSPVRVGAATHPIAWSGSRARWSVSWHARYRRGFSGKLAKFRAPWGHRHAVPGAVSGLDFIVPAAPHTPVTRPGGPDAGDVVPSGADDGRRPLGVPGGVGVIGVEGPDGVRALAVAQLEE